MVQGVWYWCENVSSVELELEISGCSCLQIGHRKEVGSETTWREALWVKVGVCKSNVLRNTHTHSTGVNKHLVHQPLPHGRLVEDSNGDTGKEEQLCLQIA